MTREAPSGPPDEAGRAAPGRVGSGRDDPGVGAVRRLRMLWRGVRRRCPRCGAGGVFASYFDLDERCHGCGLGFEREEGYWLGAMIINLVATEALFGLLLVGGMLLTWPTVPWTTLLVAGIAVNAVFPLAFYPWSKTLWLATDLLFNPPSVTEEAEAVARRRTADEGGEPGAR